MKKRNIFYLLVTICLPLFSLLFTSSSTGISGNANNGCICHSININTTNLNITGVPTSGYQLGSTYTLTVSVSNPSYAYPGTVGGFDMTCSDGAFTAGAGTQLNGSKEILHAVPDTMTNGSSSWNIDWTAPTSGYGPIIFRLAGNACNGNGTSGGDQPYRDIFWFDVDTVASAAPLVSNVLVSNITATTATIDASIVSNGGTTTPTVEYGLTATLGTVDTLNPQPVGGTAAVPVNKVLINLSPNTTYYFSVGAVNDKGNTSSQIATFTTLAPNATSNIEAIELLVYPNPARNVIYISKDKASALKHLTICNLMGELRPMNSVNIDANTLRCDIAELSPGIYFIYGKLGDKDLVKKIIIQ